MNRKKATLQGIEVEARQALGGGFSVRGLNTYLDARDGDDGRLPGRPYHKTSLQISYEDQKNGWDATLWNDWLAGYYLQKKNHSGSIMNLVIHKKINENFSAYSASTISLTWKMTSSCTTAESGAVACTWNSKQAYRKSPKHHLAAFCMLANRGFPTTDHISSSTVRY